MNLKLTAVEMQGSKSVFIIFQKSQGDTDGAQRSCKQAPRESEIIVNLVMSQQM
jgi:hypothetical protein